LVAQRKAHLEAFLVDDMNKKLLTITFISSLSISLYGSIFTDIKEGSKDAFYETKYAVKDTFRKIKDNNTTKTIKKETVNSFRVIKTYTKDGIEYSKNKIKKLAE